MVEEMYKEETGDADVDSNSSSETNPRASKSNAKASEERAEDLHQAMEPKRDEMNDVEMMGSDANSIFHSQKTEHESSLYQDAVTESNCGNERFMAGYSMSELERFGNNINGGVSLTLGLQQCENGRMGIPNNNNNNLNAFIPLRESDVYNTASASGMGSESAEFECLDSGNRQHRLVSSLLPSFT